MLKCTEIEYDTSTFVIVCVNRYFDLLLELPTLMRGNCLLKNTSKVIIATPIQQK